MDSSPDLSLKLRRGSNDSRDSYYMDFAQGIDSDIEEVATIATAPPGNVEVASTDSSDSQVAVVLPAASDLDNNDNEIGAEPSPPPPLPESPPMQSPPPPPLQSPPPPLQPSPPLPPTPQQRRHELDLELELNLELQVPEESEQEDEEAEEQQHEQQEQEHESEPEPEPEPEADPEQEQELESASDEPLPATPIPSPPPTPPASPPPLYVAPLEPIATIPTMPHIVPSNTLATSANAIASLTDTSTTDEDDISQTTPLPMPILPPLKTDLFQMLPTNDRLVLGDDERLAQYFLTSFLMKLYIHFQIYHSMK